MAEWPEASGPAALGKQAGSPATAPASFFPAPKGTLYGATLLVDFSDSPARRTPSEVLDWLNAKGFRGDSCNGSVRDYFADMSNGQVDFWNDVYGYYRARRPKTFYEENEDGARLLLEEALAHFDPQVDFSKYDNDRDGRTEAVSIVYAGAAVSREKSLWPHAGYYGLKRDRVAIPRYQVTDLPGRFTLYTFVHESGHMVFSWPDLYWFGDYCVMGNRHSEANPMAVNDFFRADQGWMPVVDLNKATRGQFKAVAGGWGYRYVNPAKPQELFFWSNVRNTGRRSALKGGGLLVLHFDRTRGRGGNRAPGDLALSVVEAQGRELTSAQWPFPGHAASDFFYRGDQAELSDFTVPSARWNSDSASGLRLYTVSPPGEEMNFFVGPPGPARVRVGEQERLGLPGAPASAGPEAWYDLKGARVPAGKARAPSGFYLPSPLTGHP